MGAKRKPPAKRPSGATRRIAGGLPCPECDFVARHAMGLGRHRSSRHGTVPKSAALASRPKPVPPGGAWLTREQASERVGVHYNTIRHWERRGLIRTTKRPGIRGIFVHGEDVERTATGAPARGPGGKMVSIEELERRYAELISNIERLLAATKRGSERLTIVRGVRPGSPAGGRGPAKAKARPARGGRRRSRR